MYKKRSKRLYNIEKKSKNSTKKSHEIAVLVLLARVGCNILPEVPQVQGAFSSAGQHEEGLRAGSRGERED